MADHSAIEWTDATWNPTTGCTKVSPGCAHCYIERTPAFRIPGNKFVHGKTDITIFHDRLEQPLHWRRPRRVFVNSLSDLFHDDISDAFIDRVFAVMALTPRHTYQVLTKRPARMRAYLAEDSRVDNIGSEVFKRFTTLRESDRAARTALNVWPLPNVWLGVSVENQHFADERIPLLLQTPAAVRFISAEPLLGKVNLDDGESSWLTCHAGCTDASDAPCRSFMNYGRCFRGLDWVIVGGESGPGARPMHPDWARSIRDQCQAAGVAFFFKQWGEWVDPMEEDRWGGWDDVVMNERGHQCADGPLLWHVGKKIAGRRLDGREWNDYPLPRGTSQTSEQSQT